MIHVDPSYGKYTERMIVNVGDCQRIGADPWQPICRGLADKTAQVRDPIKNIQAATNVSAEMANEIFRKPLLFQSLFGNR